MALADDTRHVLWLTAGAVMLLVAVAAAALVFVSRELRAARSSYTEVLHTRETIEQVRIVLSVMQDAETGERGYLITGSEDFLEPYLGAERALETELARLNDLIVDVEARDIAQELSGLARTQLEFVREVVAIRRSQGPLAAGEAVRSGNGKRHMDRIRELAAALDARERALLATQLASFQARTARSERAMQVAVLLAIVLILGGGALLTLHTQRRLRAERAARDALALLRSTIDSVTQGVAVFDAAQRLIAWNTRFLQLRGLDPAQIRERTSFAEIMQLGAGLTVQAGSIVQDTSGMLSIMADARKFEVEATRADGAVLQVRGQPMPDGNYIMTYTDVTALKLSETAYRDQATRLTAILDSVVDAIVTINASGSVESWNGGAERLFGYKAEEILRRNVRVLMPEPHSSAHDGYIRHYLQTGERRIIGQRREVQALRKDGRRVPVDLGISEMRIGERRLFIGIVRDLSARHEIEQLKASFVSTVSHELRTPLTSISGSLGLLAGGVAGALPAKAARLIDIARLNCERLVRLINDILDLERAESGRLELRLEFQPLRPIVQQAIDANRAYAQNFGASIELAPDSDDAHVLVDRDRLTQVLTNVLSNAAKFSPSGAVVLVSIRTEADCVRISVRDEGPGIAADFQQRIFQRFAQADSSDSRAKGGTGLGLSIAKTIMERLGGSIGFDSVAGHGTTFHIRLPVRRPLAACAHEGAQVTERHTVLICEDDPDVAQSLLDILHASGLDAQVVTSARDAKRALEHARYDIALVDLHLPDANGLELISELRSRAETHALPIVVVTAGARASADAGQVAGLQLADWLQKPIDPRRLLDTIRNVLRELRGRRARILHVEDDESLTHLVKELLAEDADVVAAHSLAQARHSVAAGNYDLVILDIALGDGSGLDLLPLLQPEGSASTPVILYSATEPSRELSRMVQAALVKSRDSVEQLLATVRALAGRGVAEEGRGT